jgi:hypothetical protein
VFTASPVAPYSMREPAPTGPSTTSPLSIPTRTERPPAVGSDFFDDPQARAYGSLGTVLVRQGRSEKCEYAVSREILNGTPSSSIASTSRSTAPPRRSRASSGSSDSANEVEPMRSAKAGRNSLPLLAHTPIVRRTGSERILFAAGERDAVRSPSSALPYRQRATSKLSPKPVPKLGRFAARPETRAFAGDSPLGAVVLTTEPLPTKERLSGVGSGNKNAHLRAVL